MEVKFNIRDLKLYGLFCASAATLLASLTYAATTNQTRQLAAGDKAQVTGSILSRDGDFIRVRDKKSNDVVVVNITDNTRIERKQHRVVFPRHTDMDVTAMLPGLTIEAEGVGNSKGQLDADKISYPRYLDWAARHLRPGGLVIGDNAFLFGELGDPTSAPSPELAAMRAFHERLARGGEFRATVLPTGEGLALGVRLP